MLRIRSLGTFSEPTPLTMADLTCEPDTEIYYKLIWTDTVNTASFTYMYNFDITGDYTNTVTSVTGSEHRSV